MSFDENRFDKGIFNKIRELLETTTLSESIKEKLSDLWDRHPDSRILDRPIENKELVEYLTYGMGKDRELDDMLLEVADSVGLRKVLMSSSALGFMNSWQESTTNSRSQEFNDIVYYLKNGEFKEAVPHWRYIESDDIKEIMDIEKKIWRDIIGDGTIRVYRGVDISKEKLPDIGKTVAIDNTISSWSISPEVASIFGNIVVARTISVDDIVASFLSMNFASQGSEGELILHTPEEGVDVDVIFRSHNLG